jgi:probable rRNA maturation factor
MTFSSLSIQNRTRQSTPRVKFENIKNRVLGPAYELSLVFVGHTTSRALNRVHRGKDKPTNVLSFTLSEKSGEIFIDLSKARQEMKKFGMNLPKFIAYLFIHGSLHLKGMSHGDKMEKLERKILNVSSNRSWY